MIAVIDLGWGRLALVAALILVNAVISLSLQLGLGRRLLTAAVRTVLQLLLLGVVLQWVFAADEPWAVVTLRSAMLVKLLVLLTFWASVSEPTSSRLSVAVWLRSPPTWKTRELSTTVRSSYAVPAPAPSRRIWLPMVTFMLPAEP